MTRSPQRRCFGKRLAPALGLAFVIALLQAAATGSQDDATEREERLAIGQQGFRDNCLMCHSEELVTSQRLTAPQWKTEVEKMVGWGAPVPEEQRGPLLDYLVSRYPPNAPRSPLERIAPEEVERLARAQPKPLPGDPTRGSTLFSANCATCHGPKALGGDLGTNLVEKPVLLRETEFHEVVRQGRHRMPGFVNVLKPEQEADILVWLRSLTTADHGT
jgi:mono/diheme cytochrome c family protein